MNALRTVRFLLPLLIAVTGPTLAQDTDQAPDVAKEQIESLTKRLAQSETRVKLVAKSAKALSQNFKAQSRQVDTLKADLDELRLNQKTSAQDLSDAVTLRFFTLLGMLATVLALVVVSFWVLRLRLQASESGFGEKFDRAVALIRDADQRMAQADANLARELSSLLVQIKEGRQNQFSTSKGTSEAQDHSLALKLADEIHRMRKRLNVLPEDTKGLGPLKKSVERLVGELAEQGYEIIDHTGKSYTENLSVNARFIPSDEVGINERRITKVVVPQVNFKGAMIRMADIEVSAGA